MKPRARIARHLTASILALFGVTALVPALGQDAAIAKGQQIARAADAAYGGYGFVSAEGRMILRDRGGGASVRQFTTRTVEMTDDGDRTEIAFQTPLDVRGMTLLTHSNKRRDDDQWLFLPALTRVKRIASGSRSGSFAGSEFSYEDLVGYSIEKNEYRWLRDEPCPGNPGRTCHVNQQVPKSADSGYSKMNGWLDEEDFRTYKVEYFDRAGGLIKTLVARDFQLYKGKFWRAHNVTMTNHGNGKSTEMEWSRFNFDTPVRPVDLEPFNLGKK